MKRNTLKKYLPYEYYKKIEDINYSQLLKNGYNTIFIDLDNTIADYETDNPKKETIDLINSIKEMGFEIIILSNNKGERVNKFSKEFNIKAYFSLRKPFTNRLKKHIKIDELDQNKIIWIGDQVMTDVKCASKLNIKTILVDPIKPETEKWYTKINRFFERRILNKQSKLFNDEFNKLGLNERWKKI